MLPIYRHVMLAGGFAHRHRILVLALWAQIPLVAASGFVTGQTMASVGIACLVLAALAVSAMLIPGRLLAASVVALGLAGWGWDASHHDHEEAHAEHAAVPAVQ